MVYSEGFDPKTDWDPRPIQAAVQGYWKVSRSWRHSDPCEITVGQALEVLGACEDLVELRGPYRLYNRLSELSTEIIMQGSRKAQPESTHGH